MGAALRAAARAALDLLFPTACVGCGTYPTPTSEVGRGNFGSGHRRDQAEQWLCASCRLRISQERPRCVVCGTPSPTGRTCYACQPRTSIAGVIAVGRYADPILRAAITQFKFQGVRALAEPLGELLARRVAAAGISRKGPSPRPDVVLVPLPLHRRRERARGFNQAALLAEVIGRTLGLPVVHLLSRRRATAYQTSIIESPRARQRNVAGAFALKLPAAGGQLPERVLLVDDVLTTGATLTEAARTIAASGAPELWAAVVARG